jgi:hypothetical protein
MNTPVTVKPSKDRLIMSAEEWLNADFSDEESEVLIGSPCNALVRPLTKNLIQAPEKAYKTTLLLRLTLGLSSGETVFPSLPVCRPQRVLYLHGELNSAELKERLRDAAQGLSRPLDQFFQGRSLTASLVTDEGQEVIRKLVEQFHPNVFVLDPWQSLIAGAEENSFKEMSVATRFLDQLIEDYGLTLFIAVHEGKDSSRGARGHSVIGGWRDTRFALKRNGTGLTVGVDPRWGTPPKPLKLNLRAGTLWEDNAPKWTKQAVSIRKLIEVNGGSVTRDQLALGLELDEGALRMALSRAHASGAIEVDGDSIRLSVSE